MAALDTQIDGDHYKRLKVQPAEYCHWNDLKPLEADAIAYITRNRFKNGRQDIEKAIHTLQIFLELEYPSEPPARV